MNLAQLKQNVIIEGQPLLTVSRGLRWAAHCALGHEATIEIWKDGPTLTLVPKMVAHGSTSLYMKRLGYEPHLAFLASITRPGMVVADVGANVGVYALTLAAQVGTEGHVYAFEPGEHSLARLRHNCAVLNPDLPVTICPVALSDRIGRSGLFHVGGAPTTFSLGGDAITADESVDLTTFDTWATMAGLTDLDIMKIDVEGHELRTLRGARQFLGAHHPMILFESSASALARNGDSAAEIWSLLRGLGYGVFTLASDDLEPQPAPAEGNYYAVHPSSPWMDLTRP